MTTANTGGLSEPAPSGRTFLGHPVGLGYLAFTEAWERFSFYGMQTLLVLYMTKVLLLPGHVENVALFAQFRLLYGGLDGQALASAIFGTYAASVYLTPILAGFIRCDRGRQLPGGCRHVLPLVWQALAGAR